MFRFIQTLFIIILFCVATTVSIIKINDFNPANSYVDIGDNVNEDHESEKESEEETSEIDLSLTPLQKITHNFKNHKITASLEFETANFIYIPEIPPSSRL